jgi:hypothetical protein
MKKTVINIVALFLVSAGTSLLAGADTMTEQVTFAHPVVVNGKVVEDGIYKVEFNDQTRMLTIKEGDDIIASAPARLERFEDKFNVEYTTRNEAGRKILLSVTMDDGYRAVLLS